MRQIHVGFLRNSTWLAALMILLALAGCHSRHHSSSEPTLPYKVAGTSDSVAMKMQGHFNKNGVKVVTVGQDYMISIPAAALFADESPRLLWESFALLNDINCYLKQFRQVGINITVYGGKCVSAKRDRSLTLARARAVGDYLWSQGVDSRFIFTQGLGSDKPIGTYAQSGDQSPNSRIEITFRDEVA